MLEEEVPGDGIICLDGDNGRAREVIQQQVTSLIAEFLQSSVWALSERSKQLEPSVSLTSHTRPQ